MPVPFANSIVPNLTSFIPKKPVPYNVKPPLAPFMENYDRVDNLSTTKNRPYNPTRAAQAYHFFKEKGFSDAQTTAIIANMIEESGVDPYADSKTGFTGLLQWEKDRYKAPEKTESTTYKDEDIEFNKQLDMIYRDLINFDGEKNWNHGGKDSGYNKAIDAYDAFNNADSYIDATRAFTYGYVRPHKNYKKREEANDNRTAVAEQIINKIK